MMIYVGKQRIEAFYYHIPFQRDAELSVILPNQLTGMRSNSNSGQSGHYMSCHPVASVPD